MIVNNLRDDDDDDKDDDNMRWMIALRSAQLDTSVYWTPLHNEW